MEWIIGGLIFIVFAKKGLRKQEKQIDVKEAVAEVSANVAIELAELFEVEVKSTKKAK